MKKLSFNQGTLVIDENQIYFELPARELMIDTPQELDLIFQLPDISFPCQVNRSSNLQSFFFLYQIEPGFLPLQQFRFVERAKKLAIVDQLVRIAYYFETQTQLVTVFHPLNFFADQQGRVKLLYRGIKGLMPAEGYEQESLLDQVRRLVLLFSESRFEDLRVNGVKRAYQQALSGERPWIKQLIEIVDLSQFLTLIQKERQAARNDIALTADTEDQQPTKKSPVLPLTGLGKKITQLPLLPRRRQRLIDWFKVLRHHKLLYILSLLTMGSLLFLIILYLMVQNSLQPVTRAESQTSPVLAGLRYAAIQEYQQAADEFVKVDFHKLDRQDQKAVIFTYLRLGQYERVLSLNRSYADVVIAYLLRTQNIEAVDSIQSQIPEIRFEQAALKQDIATMMQLKGEIQMDERRIKLIIDAYLIKGDLEGAHRYINQLDDKESYERYIDEFSPASK